MKARMNWRRVQTAVASFFVLALVFLVGFLAVRALSEPERIRATVDRQLVEDCAFFGDAAALPLQPTSSEFARRLVRNAKRSYDARGCAFLYGQPAVDPDAYQPAPSPAPAR